MKVDIDELIAEIRENVRKDRATLEAMRDKIAKSPEGEDQFTMNGAADSMSRLSDSLTRMNLQLVELVKMKIKAEALAGGKDDDSDSEEKEAMFDQIGEGFGRQEEEDSN